MAAVQGPLLIWLLGRDVKQTNKLFVATQNIVAEASPGSATVSVACMMNLWATLGPAKVYIPSIARAANTRGRGQDLDHLTENKQECEFLHYLFERTKLPKGLKACDIVVVFGNSLLAKLKRIQKHFRVQLLCVDSGKQADLDHLSKELDMPIEVLADVSDTGLLKWLEAAGSCHVTAPDWSAGLMDSPYMAKTRERLESTSHTLKGLPVPNDWAVIESCRCQIPELRSSKRPESESEDGSFDEDGAPLGYGKTKRQRTAAPDAPVAPSAPSLTSDSVKAWAERHLEVTPRSKLEYHPMKKEMEKFFKVTRIPEGLMQLAGILKAPNGAKTFVKDSSKQKLGLRA